MSINLYKNCRKLSVYVLKINFKRKFISLLSMNILHLFAFFIDRYPTQIFININAITMFLFAVKIRKILHYLSAKCWLKQLIYMRFWIVRFYIKFRACVLYTSIGLLMPFLRPLSSHRQAGKLSAALRVLWPGKLPLCTRPAAGTGLPAHWCAGWSFLLSAGQGVHSFRAKSSGRQWLQAGLVSNRIDRAIKLKLSRECYLITKLMT